MDASSIPPPPPPPLAALPAEVGAGGAPPPPPAGDDETVRSTLQLGRTLALLMAVIAGVLFLALLAVTIAQAILGTGLLGSVGGLVYCLVSAAVNFLIWREIPALQVLARERDYATLHDRLLLWMIMGFLFFVVEGVVLLLAWLKIDSLSHAPSPASSGAKRACPRCGGALTWIPSYQREYCFRCGAYA